MDSLSDEVCLVIYSYLEVGDLLVLRKVSFRHKRLTMDKEMWKRREILYWEAKGAKETVDERVKSPWW